MDVQGQRGGYGHGRYGYGSSSGPMARGSYAIRDRRIVRQASYAPIESAPESQATEPAWRAAGSAPSTGNSNKKLAFIAGGVVFGVIGLSGLVFAFGGGSEPSAIASRPAASNAGEETAYTVEDTNKQPPADVLGASNTAATPGTAPATPPRSAASNPSRPVVRPAASQTPVTPGAAEPAPASATPSPMTPPSAPQDPPPTPESENSATGSESNPVSVPKDPNESDTPSSSESGQTPDGDS